MQPNAYRAFGEEFTCEYNARANAGENEHANVKTKIDKVRAAIDKLNDTIKADVPEEALRDEMQTMENQRSEIESNLEEVLVTTPRLHPNLTTIYQQKITSLIDALNAPETITQANAAIRQLIAKAWLAPEGNTLNMDPFW